MLRALILCALAGPAAAESVIATRLIRADAVIEAGDLTLVDAEVPGALTDAAIAIGQAARVTIYAGRPVRESDLARPSVIDRNQIVTLVYTAGGLGILTEGRALAKGGVGDTIRVMNLTSRSTVSGRIGPDGRVLVGPSY